MKTAIIDRPLQAAIDRIRAQEQPDIAQIGLAQQAQRAKLRRALGRGLAPLLKGALDGKKIGAALARHQARQRTLVEQGSPALARRQAAIARHRKAALLNTRRALDLLQLQPAASTVIPLTTPFMIYANPAGMLTDSHTEPYNSFAKFAYTSDRDTGYGTAAVKFYFAWQNPSQYLAVINCRTNLLLAGIIEATAEQGWLFPGSSWIELTANLTVHVGTTVINYYGTQHTQMGQVGANGGWAEVGGSGDINAENIYGAYPLSAPQIFVEGREVVVFEVACSADWWIDSGGSIVLDFDDEAGRYHVAVPVVQVELLTAPDGPLEPVVFA
jgi:hypothetical protein